MRSKGALFIVWLLVLFPVLAMAQGSAPKPPTLVARVSYLEGELLRYVPAEEDWVATVVDSPVGPKDVFYSDKDGRAEISFPNKTQARLGPSTQVEVVSLEPDLTDLYVASGQFRAYNRSSDTYFRISTPFGYAVAPPGTIVEMYVGDESVEVLSLKGKAQFMHVRDGYETKYDLLEGGSSIIADKDAVARGDGTVDADWDRWNGDRDSFWGQKRRVRSQHVPDPLEDDAWVLEENGRWERVYYEGEYRTLWRPTTVPPDWAPYTVGRWTTWYDEQVWIPYEPFGYVTHHYGNWVVVGGVWYWMPPTVTVVAGFPRPWVYWYPGRVAWIYTDVYVGWVPLAPWEPFYAVHFWGPGVTVWAGPVVPAITIGTLAFVDYAICVHHHHFWGVDYHHHGYYGVRVTNINKTVIINNFRPTTVVHKTVFKDVHFAKNQYKFVEKDVKVKPHPDVVRTLRERKVEPVKASLLAEKVKKAPQGKIEAGKRIPEPKVTHKMVKADEVSKPHARFEELKPKGKPQRPAVEKEAVAKPERPKPPVSGRREAEGVSPKGEKVERPKPGAARLTEEGARPERKASERPERPKRVPPGEAGEVEKRGPKPPSSQAVEEKHRPQPSRAGQRIERPSDVERPAQKKEVERPSRVGERPPRAPEGEGPKRMVRPEDQGPAGKRQPVRRPPEESPGGMERPGGHGPGVPGGGAPRSGHALGGPGAPGGPPPGVAPGPAPKAHGGEKAKGKGKEKDKD